MTRRRPSARPTEYRSLSDAELCRAAQRELPYITRAYEELMRRHERLLFGVCLRILGNRQDAEDVTQDVMLKIFVHLPKFESRSSLKTWIVRIASNASKDWIKKKATSRHYTEALVNEPLGAPVDGSQGRFRDGYEEQNLIGLLNELSPADREVLTLRYVADLSLAEIAETADLSLSATKMRLYRAVERLQQLAQQVYGDDL